MSSTFHSPSVWNYSFFIVGDLETFEDYRPVVLSQLWRVSLRLDSGYGFYGFLAGVSQQGAPPFPLHHPLFLSNQHRSRDTKKKKVPGA